MARLFCEMIDSCWWRFEVIILLLRESAVDGSWRCRKAVRYVAGLVGGGDFVRWMDPFQYVDDDRMIMKIPPSQWFRLGGILGCCDFTLGSLLSFSQWIKLADVSRALRIWFYIGMFYPRLWVRIVELVFSIIVHYCDWNGLEGGLWGSWISVLCNPVDSCLNPSKWVNFEGISDSWFYLFHIFVLA